MATSTPNLSGLMTVLGGFLQTILPAGVAIVQGQGNRVSEPSVPDFVVMTPILRNRLETDVVAYADVAFTASASGQTLSVSAVQFGQIAIGSTLFGAPVAAGTTIVSGPAGGGAGSYQLSSANNFGAQTLAAGEVTLTQPVQITVQCDVHSANSSDAADMAATITTLFRSAYATDTMASGSTGVWPLYADDARQIAFTDAEQQVESRWIVDLTLQMNQAVTVAQQFAGAVSISFVPAG